MFSNSFIRMFLALAILCSMAKPIWAQSAEREWLDFTFPALEKLALQAAPIYVTLYPAMDTELEGPIKVIVSRKMTGSAGKVFPQGSSILCRYKAVRGGHRIPATCHRVITPEGFDYRIHGTLHGEDGLPGIPRDGIKQNGALLVDQGKGLIFHLENIEAVGFIGGPLYRRN